MARLRRRKSKQPVDDVCPVNIVKVRIRREVNLSSRSCMDRCQNHCLYWDVKDVLIKILIHFGGVEFLVKGLVSFVPEGVGMIVNFRGSASGILEHKVYIFGSFSRGWIMLLNMVKDSQQEIRPLETTSLTTTRYIWDDIRQTRYYRHCWADITTNNVIANDRNRRSNECTLHLIVVIHLLQDCFLPR